MSGMTIDQVVRAMAATETPFDRQPFASEDGAIIRMNDGGLKYDVFLFVYESGRYAGLRFIAIFDTLCTFEQANYINRNSLMIRAETAPGEDLLTLSHYIYLGAATEAAITWAAWFFEIDVKKVFE